VVAVAVALAVIEPQQDTPLLLVHPSQSQLALVVRHLLRNTLLVEIAVNLRLLALSPLLVVVMVLLQIAALLLLVLAAVAALAVVAHSD
jgi:hypothetical protein